MLKDWSMVVFTYIRNVTEQFNLAVQHFGRKRKFPFRTAIWFLCFSVSLVNAERILNIVFKNHVVVRGRFFTVHAV
jgi:hypothetical protein